MNVCEVKGGQMHTRTVAVQTRPKNRPKIPAWPQLSLKSNVLLLFTDSEISLKCICLSVCLRARPQLKAVPCRRLRRRDAHSSERDAQIAVYIAHLRVAKNTG